MTVAAFAAPEGFVHSPTGRPAPGIVTFDPADDDCSAKLVITPYGDKDALPEDIKKQLEKAFDDIINADNLKDLCDGLADVVGNKTAKVSDLFNVHTTDCKTHDDHVDFDVVLEADNLKNFAGLMYRDNDGKWVLVKDAKVSGNHLKFSLDNFDGAAPFAIVVTTGTNAPQTGDTGYTHVYLTIMAVSGLALAVVLVASKKKFA
jgi:hypothetical protein